MDNFKVSIIVPAYNLENYIRKTLKSIENQTYKNLELLVINDGSRDLTSEVASEFLSKTSLKYKVIDKENGGVSDARNIGIENATGDYLMFLDGDDYIENTTLEKVVAEFSSSNEDFIYYGMKSVDEKDKVLADYPKESFLDNLITGKELIIKLLSQEVETIPMHAFFCKTKIVKDNNIKFTKGCTNGEDQEFYLKYLCHCNKVKSINEYLCYYVQREGSISNSVNFSKFTVLEAFDRIKIYIKKHIDDNRIDSLLENKYKREFFTNFNSIIKFYSGSNDTAYEVLEKYKYILDMGNYKVANSSKSEKIFAIRYSMMRNFPKLYINLFKFIYRKKRNKDDKSKAIY